METVDTSKTCWTCKQCKSISDFRLIYNPPRPDRTCRQCQSAKQRARYYHNKLHHPERIARQRLITKNWLKAWRARGGLNAYNKRRYHSDPQFRIRCCIQSRLCGVISGQYSSKSMKELCGVESIDQLKQIIESKFTDGMTWENHGNGDGRWNLDHIRPLASFTDLTDRAQLLIAFHHSNLQPIWSGDNKKKNSSWNGSHYRKVNNELVLQRIA